MTNIYRKEAIRLGNEIVDLAINDKNGIYWKALAIEPNGELKIGKVEDLNTGNSGTAIFLLTLYKITRDIKYLKTAEKAMQWTIEFCKSHPTKKYGLIYGRMGVCLVLLELFQLTKNSTYLNAALEIGKKCENFLEYENVNNDYYLGIAGTIIALLHLHVATKESWILSLIDKYTQHLIKNIKFGKNGIYWDDSYMKIRPLCGFSHGAGGIGFVFLELGHYFKNPSFYYIAEEAFAYEDYYYEKNIHNWPDFILYQKFDEYEKAYENGTLRIQANDTNRWCHGAAGIGLIRLRAYELLKNEKYKKDVYISIEKSKETYIKQLPKTYKWTISSLCCGSSGVGNLFLQSYLIFGTKKYLDNAKGIAKWIIKQRKEPRDDKSERVEISLENNVSLLKGSAGIGYFFLQIFCPEKVPSLLLPKIDKVCEAGIDSNKYPFLAISLSKIKKTTIENIFPKTIEAMDTYSPRYLQDHFMNESKHSDSEKYFFIKFVKRLLQILPVNEKEKISKPFYFELLKVHMTDAKFSSKTQGLTNIFLYLKNEYNKKIVNTLTKLPTKEFLDTSVKHDPNISLVKSSSTENTFILLKTEPTDIREIPINALSKKIIRISTKSISIKDLITILTKNASHNKFIKTEIMQNIKMLLKQNILFVE